MKGGYHADCIDNYSHFLCTRFRYRTLDAAFCQKRCSFLLKPFGKTEPHARRTNSRRALCDQWRWTYRPRTAGHRDCFERTLRLSSEQMQNFPSRRVPAFFIAIKKTYFSVSLFHLTIFSNFQFFQLFCLIVLHI